MTQTQTAQTYALEIKDLRKSFGKKSNTLKNDNSIIFMKN